MGHDKKWHPVTKSDFYDACCRFFPGHEIVETASSICPGRVFTDCKVAGRLVMRWCPANDKYGEPAHVILFLAEDGTLCITLGEDLPEFLGNMQDKEIHMHDKEIR